MLPDQRDLWAETYGESPAPAARTSAFVEACLQVLPPASHILELGCGTGVDAEAFANAGHTVIATDFVPAVIATAQARDALIPELTFREMRIDRPFPFADAEFDAVYAHLTLHYYTHAKTREIVTEIHRVLKPGGLILFACKSPADPAWGRGTEVEPNLFDFHGKVRHFFTEEYAREILTDGFTDIIVTSHTGKLYRQKSGWITAIACRA
jgi:SAM-dependent methyltransferase